MQLPTLGQSQTLHTMRSIPCHHSGILVSVLEFVHLSQETLRQNTLLSASATRPSLSSERSRYVLFLMYPCPRVVSSCLGTFIRILRFCGHTLQTMRTRARSLPPPPFSPYFPHLAMSQSLASPAFMLCRQQWRTASHGARDGRCQGGQAPGPLRS